MKYVLMKECCPNINILNYMILQLIKKEATYQVT